jgi:hypothetical protein
MKYLYRFVDNYEDDVATYNILKYLIIKKTAKGFWIDLGYRGKKFVLEKGKNLFAFDSEYKALWNYLCRKEKQFKILSGKLEDTERRHAHALSLWKTMDKL